MAVGDQQPHRLFDGGYRVPADAADSRGERNRASPRFEEDDRYPRGDARLEGGEEVVVGIRGFTWDAAEEEAGDTDGDGLMDVCAPNTVLATAIDDHATRLAGMTG